MLALRGWQREAGGGTRPAPMIVVGDCVNSMKRIDLLRKSRFEAWATTGNAGKGDWSEKTADERTDARRSTGTTSLTAAQAGSNSVDREWAANEQAVCAPAAVPERLVC